MKFKKSGKGCKLSVHRKANTGSTWTDKNMHKSSVL